MTDPNRLRIASNKIKKKYIHQKSKRILEKASKKADDWFKRAGHVDIDDLETIDYHNDTSVNELKDTNTNDTDNINLKKTSGAQRDTKKIVKKYRNITKKTVEKALATIKDDLAELETVDCNIDTNINDLDDIVHDPKKLKMLMLLLRMSKRKSPLPFNINDVADTETVDYKYDTNINDVSSDNSAQIAAKKTVNKYKNLI